MVILKKTTKGVLVGIVGAILLALGIGFVVIKAKTYQPAELARQALTSKEVKIEEKEKLTIFSPIQPDKDKPAVLFYQGALVEEASYSYLAEALAQRGYSVYLLHHPLNLPVLAMNAGEQVMKDHQLTRVVVGGHSLGGVVASRFARQQENGSLAGIFFLASYPDGKGSLASFQGPVLSITASKDQVLNWDNYQKSQQYLPEHTTFVSIAGGNHSGFGAYGQQKGDGKVSLTTKEQQEEVVNYLVAWLASM